MSAVQAASSVVLLTQPTLTAAGLSVRSVTGPSRPLHRLTTVQAPHIGKRASDVLRGSITPKLGGMRTITVPAVAPGDQESDESWAAGLRVPVRSPSPKGQTVDGVEGPPQGQQLLTRQEGWCAPRDQGGRCCDLVAGRGSRPYHRGRGHVRGEHWKARFTSGHLGLAPQRSALVPVGGRQVGGHQGLSPRQLMFPLPRSLL